MPTKTPVSKTYPQSTCTISVEGKSLTPEAIARLTPPVNCTIQFDWGNSTQQFEGDGEVLHDLVTTIDRYLAYMLSSQSQGTFSGSVAIRPLDAVRHRITLRQGQGIGQVDLTISQLYDLAESLGEIKQAIPHLDRLKTPPQSIAWYRRPVTGVAALVALGVGIATASLVLTRPSTQEVGVSEFRVEPDAAQVAEAPSEPTAEGEMSQRSVETTDNQGVDDRLAASAPPSASDSRSSLTDLPERQDGLVPEDLAALSPQATPDFDSSMLADLESSLGSDWQSPPSLTEPLSYDLTVAPDGSILSAVPATEQAKDLQPQTPLADLPTSPAAAGTLVRVTLGPENDVSAIVPPLP